ncbi:hypothetical protein DRN63_01830 [Nanoarchaeota archaeon]|nr:MAG: hypothetical protein DRN63_01830 [Nanoarchaeota archaeon]
MKFFKLRVEKGVNSIGRKFIQVTIFTSVGKFKASVPSGTSKSKFEYKFDFKKEIRKLRKLGKELEGREFSKVEDIFSIEKKTKCLPLSLAILKALAKEKKVQPWKLLELGEKLPIIISKIFGGGKHSVGLRKRPEFQEFLVFPEGLSVKKNVEVNKLVYKEALRSLKKHGYPFRIGLEGGLITKLSNEEVLNLLCNVVQKLSYKLGVKINLGLDVAASSFWERGKYKYKRGYLDKDSQLKYMKFLIEEYDLKYVEDPFQQEDFESFAKLRKFFDGKVLICGDDLLSTNVKRLRIARKKGAVNSCIVKPNQCYSLLETLQFMKEAKKFKFLRTFSHRSLETPEKIFADLSVGCEMYKISVVTRERVLKLKRLMKIEEEIRSERGE